MFLSIKTEIAFSVIPKNLAFYFLYFDIKSNFVIQQGTIIFYLSNMWFMVEIMHLKGSFMVISLMAYEIELLLQMSW
jgi:hypothetical protein